MEQPVLLSDSPTAFAQDALLVSAEVDLQVAFLCGPVVTVRTLEGLLACVRAHVQREDAVEAETLPAQRAGVLPVLTGVVFLGRAQLGDDALVGDPQELGEFHSSIHTAQNPSIHQLIG